MSAAPFATSALALCAALTLAAAFAPARAQVNLSTINNSLSLTLDGNTGSLLPGPDNASSFHMNFLLDDTRRMTDTPLGTTHDLEISLTSPNNSVFRFMFSPRPQFGIGYDPISGTNRAYAGITWDLFSMNSWFGHFGLASSFDPGLGSPEARRFDDAPLMFHGAVEFGYRFNESNALLFAIDQGVAPYAHGMAVGPIDNFTLRYGTKF
jgi:hypothetical protein